MTRFLLPSTGKWPMTAAVVVTISIALALSGCHNKTSQDFVAAGDSALNSQKLDEAEGDYKQAVDLAPSDPRPHTALGNLYILEHKPAAAQPEYMRVLELDPKDAAAHAALGNLYNDQAQYPMAESQFRAAIAIDPTRSNYHTDLGVTLAKEGRPADAQTELRTAIGFDPKNAQAHFQLANLLATIPGREADAQAEYAQAKQLDPSLVTPAAPAAAATAAAPATGVKVKAINPPELFRLTHDSPVFANPDATSAQLGHVEHRKYVHVIGISGKFLQVRLKDGTVGFIPVTAAE